MMMIIIIINTGIIHAELAYGLVDGHVVRDDVIVDQKLELVADVVALCHEHGRQTVIDVVFAVFLVAIGRVLVADPSVAADDEVLLDGLDQGQRIDFDGAALPLFDVVAGRMPLQVALELVRVEEAQGRSARAEVAARSARSAGRRWEIVHPHWKLFQLVDATAQLVHQRKEMRSRSRWMLFRRAVKEFLYIQSTSQNIQYISYLMVDYYLYFNLLLLFNYYCYYYYYYIIIIN